MKAVRIRGDFGRFRKKMGWFFQRERKGDRQMIKSHVFFWAGVGGVVVVGD